MARGKQDYSESQRPTTIFIKLYCSKFNRHSSGKCYFYAVLFVEVNGYLHEIRRMEVHEHAVPYLGHTGSTHRLVMKTQKKSPLIIPTKLKHDY